jgi:hypothetical protein
MHLFMKYTGYRQDHSHFGVSQFRPLLQDIWGYTIRLYARSNLELVGRLWIISVRRAYRFPQAFLVRTGNISILGPDQSPNGTTIAFNGNYSMVGLDAVNQ